MQVQFKRNANASSAEPHRRPTSMQREKIIDKPLSKYPYPIPSREEILGVLRTSEAPLAANDIAEAFSIKRQEREGFFKRLAAMERDGQIRLDQRNHYQLTHPST